MATILTVAYSLFYQKGSSRDAFITDFTGKSIYYMKENTVEGERFSVLWPHLSSADVLKSYIQCLGKEYVIFQADRSRNYWS